MPVAETQLPAAQTMPVPHVVPSGWLASWSTQTGVPVVHAVAPWWQGLPGAQAAPTVQVLQTPSLHTMFVPQAAPFALSVPWSWQAGAPLEQSVAPSWHGLLGVQATSAVHGPQIPLLHTMLAPQAVPSARLVPRSSQAEDPAPHESEPAWQGLAGVHVAPAAQGMQAPPLHTMLVPQSVPSGSFSSSSRHTEAPVEQSVAPW